MICLSRADPGARKAILRMSDQRLSEQLSRLRALGAEVGKTATEPSGRGFIPSPSGSTTKGKQSAARERGGSPSRGRGGFQSGVRDTSYLSRVVKESIGTVVAKTPGEQSKVDDAILKDQVSWLDKVEKPTWATGSAYWRKGGIVYVKKALKTIEKGQSLTDCGEYANGDSIDKFIFRVEYYNLNKGDSVKSLRTMAVWGSYEDFSKAFYVACGRCSVDATGITTSEIQLYTLTLRIDVRKVMYELYQDTLAKKIPLPEGTTKVDEFVQLTRSAIKTEREKYSNARKALADAMKKLNEAEQAFTEDVSDVESFINDWNTLRSGKIEGTELINTRTHYDRTSKVHENVDWEAYLQFRQRVKASENLTKGLGPFRAAIEDGKIVDGVFEKLKRSTQTGSTIASLSEISVRHLRGDIYAKRVGPQKTNLEQVAAKTEVATPDYNPGDFNEGDELLFGTSGGDEPPADTHEQ